MFPARCRAKHPFALFGIAPAETKPVDTDQRVFERLPYRSLLLVQEVEYPSAFVPLFYENAISER